MLGVFLRPPHSLSLCRRVSTRGLSSVRPVTLVRPPSGLDGRRYASTGPGHDASPIHTTSIHETRIGGERERETQKPYYITTPIFYPNAKPHIGHLYTLVLGDVFARFRRLVEPGRDVKFLVGTDEHGLKIQQAAQKAGVPEGEFVDGLSAVFRSLSSSAHITHTLFARTTNPTHRAAVSRVWTRLAAKGYVYKGSYKGWYSVTDECFYTGAQVEPSPSTLSLPPAQQTFISKETRSKVEWTEEHNYMFRLSAFRDALIERYRGAENEATPVYPPQYNAVVLGMLGASPAIPSSLSSTSPEEKDEDTLLQDISISRPRTRLTWGVPVPSDPDHTVYVWFDALLVYLSGVGGPFGSSASSLGEGSGLSSGAESMKGEGEGKVIREGEREGGRDEARKAGWPADLQIIGKDILRFHAIYLPAILMALDGPAYSPPSSSPSSSSTPSSPPSPSPSPSPASPTHATNALPTRILTHAHWTVSSTKMSKSLGNVVDPVASMGEWGVDVVRWYMCRVGGRFRDDVDWSEEQLEKHGRELQSLVGNYLLRVSSAKIVKAAEAGRGELVSSGALPGGAESESQPTSRDGDGSRPANAKHEYKYVFQHNLNAELAQMAVALPRRVRENMERLEVGEAVERVVDVLKVANKTISDIAPWSKTCSPSVIFETRQVALLTLRAAAVCLEPFVPGTGGRLLEALGVRAGSASGLGSSRSQGVSGEAGENGSDAVKSESESGEENKEDVWGELEKMEKESRLGEEMRRVWDVQGVKLF